MEPGFKHWQDINTEGCEESREASEKSETSMQREKDVLDAKGVVVMQEEIGDLIKDEKNIMGTSKMEHQTMEEAKAKTDKNNVKMEPVIQHWQDINTEGCEQSHEASEKSETSVQRVKDVLDAKDVVVLQEEIDDLIKDEKNVMDTSKMEHQTMEEAKAKTDENNIKQENVLQCQDDTKSDVIDKKSLTMEDDKEEDMLKQTLLATLNSSSSLEATTSQDNTASLSNDNESSGSTSDQNKAKKSISKGHEYGDSGISMGKSGNSSGEDLSKRQKPNESVSDKSINDSENLGESTSKFHKLKSKVKKRNYRSKRNSSGDNGENSAETNDDESEISEGTDAAAAIGPENRERGEEVNSDGPDVEDGGEGDSNEWTTASEDELEENVDNMVSYLKKEKSKPNWFVVPELFNRQLGNNPLFQRRYYGSLHVVERFELMYKLDEHKGCVNSLNFNQKGNLIASGSDDLCVVIWDWAIGKKHHFFRSGHQSNLFQAKWLPFDVEYLLATCSRDGQVRLLDTERGISRKIAAHHAPTHKLAVHPDTPHVIISVGEDAKVLSIDIRESKPNKLLIVKDGDFDVQLYSVHSNPLNSNEFCVGGRSPTLKIYDRRKLTSPLYKLCPDHLIGRKEGAYVTCAVYNYNGTEVLASYNDEDIYLFDAVSPDIGDYAHRYQGHRNSDTVKGVNFFGPKSEFVISGSDCGNIFIWDKNTEAIVNWMAGDEQGVVNCLEPHPHIPILATSGLDKDVKIWIPSCEEPPSMKNLEKCVKINTMCRVQSTGQQRDAFEVEVLWMFLRNIRRRARIQYTRTNSGNPNHDDGEEDDNAEDLSDNNESSEDSVSETYYSEEDILSRFRRQSF